MQSIARFSLTKEREELEKSWFFFYSAISCFCSFTRSTASLKQSMESSARSSEKQAHVVCITYPAQSHIKAMLKLAKLLHSNGIFVTIVNTEFNHKRLQNSGALESLDDLPGFRFETIPDGLPPSDYSSNQDILALSDSLLSKKPLPAFQNLIENLNAGALPVTSIFSDAFMPFPTDAARSLGIPIFSIWTVAACGLMGFFQVHNLIEKDLAPMKDVNYLTNGDLDTIVDWIPGMNNIRLRDIPTFLRTTDPEELMLRYIKEAMANASNSTGHVIHTFDDLEQEVLNAISSMLPNVYTIGPQQLLLNSVKSDHEDFEGIGYNLWKEEKTCLQWLDSKEADSVLYVNFGSLAIMSPEKLVEFGWGLANSNQNFLWIIKPDFIFGESKTTLGLEFMECIEGRGFISSWCPQEQVLNHTSVGGFLTHGGWNSTMESLSAGVPMLCLPFFGDQVTNCKYICTEWECGMEVNNNVRRDDVEKLVRILMEGVEGKKLKKKAMEWKQKAEKACSPDGSSSRNLSKLIHLLTS
ncbi:7-deoxyloganetin glucosyltransferase isoform X2 [Daucus carota subsp. sativus]|uniref:7-deoxyloganetin glucosyltransferase isoform X2 n=1 Tax=Daucus carota subsp. sativus TaxID=79200 RepID=UPI0007EF955D|nr:PREDICTED: 7-deoxyloganetin glucosyltransferase-like isoform X2 [Daucus carota subsp. sativus]